MFNCCVTHSLSDGWPGDTELNEEIPERVDREGPAKDRDQVEYSQPHQAPGLTGFLFQKDVSS